MYLFFSMALYLLKFVAILLGVVIVAALGLGLLLVQELNQILSATEEHEFSEKIDSSRNYSFSPTDCSESTFQTASSLRSS